MKDLIALICGSINVALVLTTVALAGTCRTHTKVRVLGASGLGIGIALSGTAIFWGAALNHADSAAGVLGFAVLTLAMNLANLAICCSTDLLCFGALFTRTPIGRRGRKQLRAERRRLELERRTRELEEEVLG